ncbi:MAG: hypothetical protein BM564_08755 [Bacteroidetes bacterium MedPE-SWsnd-G2]|nr:MAG: hypothetical protein BM564_08755 [Bacteroidetes bacterium MedPE-SWsnd-G2]
MKTVLNCFIMLIIFSIFSCQNQNEKIQTKELAVAIPVNEKPKLKASNIKVCLLLDTSNSMDGLIDQAKAQLWKIVNELSYASCENIRPELQIAIFEYGNDNLPASEGHIRLVLPFSGDLDTISKELFSLTTNGGNEYCGQVLQNAMVQLDWGQNEKDLKLIFIAGNEPFDQGQVRYQNVMEHTLKNNIVVNTIFCGDYNQGVETYWKNGADLSKGTYMAINHNLKTTHIASPYDQEIINLNNKLNKTYMAYGYFGETKLKEQELQDENAESYSFANAVSRSVSKSSHLYKNSKWDLIDASDDAEFKIEDISKEQLPDSLKALSTSELKQVISDKKQERETITKSIQSLNEKRKQFINSKENNDSNTLDNALIQAIKKQAKLKGYHWE